MYQGIVIQVPFSVTQKLTSSIAQLCACLMSYINGEKGDVNFDKQSWQEYDNFIFALEQLNTECKWQTYHKYLYKQSL